jgi:transposase
VKRVIARHESGGGPPARTPRGRNYDAVIELVTERVERSRGRITAKRLLLAAPGEHLVIDWGVLGGLHVFCAVLAWSRVRFVRFADNERADTTMALLAECFEQMGGVPAVVLADRMGCLKGGVVANKVVPTGEYVRCAANHGFAPTSARPPTRSRRGSWRTWSATPRPI